jgi:hypothetical protein
MDQVWSGEIRAAPGAGCLPLALRATSAPARTHPRGRPHGRLAATSAVARRSHGGGPSLRRPHHEALVESAWGAVPGLLLVRFPRPLAEPAVRLSTQRALHGFCR